MPIVKKDLDRMVPGHTPEFETTEAADSSGDFEYEDFSSVEVQYTSKANIPFEQLIQERKIDPFINEAELKEIVEDYLHKHGFKYAKLSDESVRSLSTKLTIYFVQRINKGE